MTTLKCKLCSFKAADLVPHIETAHIGQITLEAYIESYGGIDSVIHPSIQNPESFIAAEVPVIKKSVKIAGIDVEKSVIDPSLLIFVPEIDPAYSFQEDTMRVIMAVNERRPVLLTGHTGTGKTSLIEQIAALIGQPCLRINLNQQTSYADFVGQWSVVAGEMVWMDGALPTAMKKGMWLILDEIDYGEANILCSLNPVLERKPKLVLKENRNEVVSVHQNFRVFGTGNTLGTMSSFRHLYQGANPMNEAWLDRWRIFKVDYMHEALEASVLVRSIDKMSEVMARELVRVANLVRRAFAEETVSCTFSTRRLLDWSDAIIKEAVMAGSDKTKKAEAPFTAAKYTIYNKISREDALAIEGTLKRVLLGRE